MTGPALGLLALCGFCIAAYFTAVAWRWIDPQSRRLPGFCRMGEATCASVVFTPRARLFFGLPNSVLGQAYYLLLAAALVSGRLDEPLVYRSLLGASLLTVLVGAYLTWSLLFWTRIPCRLCFAGHAINAAIFLLLLSAA